MVVKILPPNHLGEVVQRENFGLKDGERQRTPVTEEKCLTMSDLKRTFACDKYCFMYRETVIIFL